MTEPRCILCAGYYVTHDARAPYGCRPMGVKSRRPVELGVIKASGLPCQLFQPKVKPAAKR